MNELAYQIIILILTLLCVLLLWTLNIESQRKEEAWQVAKYWWHRWRWK